jgi:hypothetical protein
MEESAEAMKEQANDIQEYVTLDKQNAQRDDMAISKIPTNEKTGDDSEAVSSIGAKNILEEQHKKDDDPPLQQYGATDKFYEDYDKTKATESTTIPLPPKRQHQQITNQKIRRWSKLMKYSLPSKLPSSKEDCTKKSSKVSKNSNGKGRKSLKDKMNENDFVVFLKERRAVSESHFRVLDKISYPRLTRTRSDQNIAEESWSTGIALGTIKDLKTKFENANDLKSPGVVKGVMSGSDVQTAHESIANDGPIIAIPNEFEEGVKLFKSKLIGSPASKSIMDVQSSVTSINDSEITSPDTGDETKR